MFQRILVPVELDHIDRMERTLEVATDLARRHDAELVFAAIAGKVPNAVARTPEQFAAQLDMFVREQAERTGVDATGLFLLSNDPGAELESKLLEAVESSKADLVVMASHPPGVADLLHLTGSHATWLVRHVSISVFVVR